MPVYKHKNRKKTNYLWYYEFQFMGERRKRSGFRTKAEAERAEANEKERIRRMKNGEYEIDEDFNTYVTEWLHGRRDLGENTKSNYDIMLRNHIIPFFNDYKINTVQPIDMRNFIDGLFDKGLSSSGVMKNYNIINKMFNELVKMNMLRTNPCNHIEKPSETSGKIQVFDRDELIEFLEFAEGYTRYAFGFKLAAATGMRRGELLALKWDRVDLDGMTIQINRKVVRAAKGTDRYIQDGTKTGDGRRIAIPPSLKEDLIRHKKLQQIEKEENEYEDNNLVIATQNGKVVDPDNFTRIFRNTLKASGIEKELSLHSLRHTHATLLLLQGVHMKIVSERLGHSSIKMTMDTYSHLLPNMDFEAMERFEELFVNKTESLQNPTEEEMQPEM